jgi:hypothetical protein
MADAELIEKWIVEAIQKHGGMILEAKLRHAVRKAAGSTEELSTGSIEKSTRALIDKGTVSVVERPAAWRGRNPGKVETELYYKLTGK